MSGIKKNVLYLYYQFNPKLMAKKTIYRTVITFTVLSEEPISEDEPLSNIADEMFDGDYYGGPLKFKQTELIGKVAVNEMEKLGYDSAFLGLDEDGNQIIEDES
jgi:hypothetical protein